MGLLNQIAPVPDRPAAPRRFGAL